MPILRRSSFRPKPNRFLRVPFPKAQLIAQAGVYVLTGNATLSVTALTAATGIYALTGSDAIGSARLSAGTGSYALAGGAASFGPRLAAAPGAYSITGQSAGGASRFVAAGGSYSLTGSNTNLDPSLSAVSGSYSITGLDVVFRLVWSVGSGSYAITLGEYELRRTGSDYPPDYYGIGHYLEAIEKAKRLEKITRKTPAPIVHETRPRLRPIQQPAPVTPALAHMLDPQVLIARRIEAEQALERQAAITKRRRQEAEILFLLAS